MESLGGYRRLIHGEAVGIGLVAEADLAVHLGFCGKDVATRIRRLVQAAGLPDRLPPRTSFGALWGAMQHDKKVVGGTVVGVWPVRIGDVVIRPLAQEACAAWFRTLESPSQRRKPAMRRPSTMAIKRPPSLAQLEQALKEKTREVDVLHRITDSISNTLDLEAVLKHIVEIVVEVTKADACLLYLLSDGQDELILRASKNPHPKLIGRITIGMGEGITGWVAQERTRVVIPSNASDDPRFKFFTIFPRTGIRPSCRSRSWPRRKWSA